MKKLLILGTSLASVEIVQTAKKLGCYTIVTDNLPPELSQAKYEADEYWMISTSDLDSLEQKCKEESIDAVFAGVSEFNLDRVEELTDRLGLPCYIDKATWKYARDKKAFKTKCKEFGIPVVEEYYVSDPPQRQELSVIKYPVVVKPIDGTGNKGLSICQNEEELIKGCKKARSQSEHDEIIVERYIRGEEYWNFYYIAEKEIRYVYSGRVFRQPGQPSFLYSFGTSAVGNQNEYKTVIYDKSIALLKDIGCSKGIAWIQCIMDNDGHYYALEMAQRMSAGTSGKSMKKSIGISAIEWMLDTVLGNDQKSEMLPKTVEPPFEAAHCAYYQFAQKAGLVTSLEGYNDLDHDIYEVSKVTYEGTYVNAYRLLVRITFVARNAKEMCERLQEINNKTKILNENKENMYVQFTDYRTVIESHKGLFAHT